MTPLRKVFADYLTAISPLTEAEISAFDNILTHRSIKKKELFAEDGKVCSKVLFISEGYFRFFHLDFNGNEITSDFYFAPCFISSYTSFLTGRPSFVNVQAMVDMEVLELHKSQLYALYDKYPSIERLGRLIAESVAVTSEEHLFLLLNQTAENRYRRFLEKNPGYVRTIPLQYIASYLGITKETLSRIRKSIH